MLESYVAVKNFFADLWSREEGATMVEYGLMVALIAVVALGAVTLLGGSVRDIFNGIAGSLGGGTP